MVVAGSYVIKNDNFRGTAECLSGLNGQSRSFRVSVSKASSEFEPDAFPEIFIGCSWGRCSPDRRLPAPLYSLRDPRTSWSTTERADGIWNAAYDLWFDRRPIRNGQATGAEIMIWLNEAGTASAQGSPIVRIDGARWYLLTWITYAHGKSWRYISFRRVDRTWHVTGLALRPFFRLAERYGWVDPRWYLLNVEAGFEIWHDGTGLSTRWFSTSLR